MVGPDARLIAAAQRLGDLGRVDPEGGRIGEGVIVRRPLPGRQQPGQAFRPGLGGPDQFPRAASARAAK